MSESLFDLRFLSRCRFGRRKSPPERKTKKQEIISYHSKSRPAAKSVSPDPPGPPTRLVPFPRTPAAREPNRCVNAGGYVLFLSAEIE